MKKKPFLSIVIPTYNEEKNIGDCIKSLKKQTYKSFEIIVVDDGSTDKTLKIVNDLEGIVLVKESHKGPGFSRNIGAKKAKGEILVFVDADMTFDKNYLKKLIDPIMNEDVLGTENEIQIASNFNKNIWTRCFGKNNFDPSSRRKIFRAIKKEEFENLGMFNPEYGYADDQTFFFEYGVRPNVAKGAICYHKNPENLKQIYKQSRWIGASYDSAYFRMPVIRYLFLILLIFVSPIIIPFFSIRRSVRNKDFSVFFPWMLLFTTSRYFGTLAGIKMRIAYGTNFR